MSSFKTRQLVFLLAFVSLLVVLPISAKGDPVVVTGGTLTYSRTGSTPFILTGSGLALNGLTSPLNAFVSLLGNGTLAPGQTGSTGGSIDSQDGELSLSNPVTVEHNLYSPGASLFALNISSGSFTVPIESVGGFVVVAPFTVVTGIVEGYASSLGVGDPIFTNPVTSSGTTTLLYLRTPSGEYQLFSQTFSFGQSVSSVTVNAIPEPATLLLLGSGLAGLLAPKARQVRQKMG